MSEKKSRHPASDFMKCGEVRLTKHAKINTAMVLYLTLEALNESAPRGCDGMPMDLTVAHGGKPVSVPRLLRETLELLKAPLPADPEPEFEEGCCGCGNPHEPDAWN